MEFNVIGTGSTGNAVLVDGVILIDCGLPFIKIKPYLDNVRWVLITHRHGDHWRPSTARAIQLEHPRIRFISGPWMANYFAKENIKPYIIPSGKSVTLPDGWKAWWDKVPHDAPNCAYHIVHTDQSGKTEKLFYCTDCGSLDGIKAMGYDYYLIEANHTVAEIEERVRKKREAGVYAYEERAAANHLSREQAEKWLANNMDYRRSQYMFLHQHDANKENENNGRESQRD